MRDKIYVMEKFMKHLLILSLLLFGLTAQASDNCLENIGELIATSKQLTNTSVQHANEKAELDKLKVFRINFAYNPGLKVVGDYTSENINGSIADKALYILELESEIENLAEKQNVMANRSNSFCTSR